jgi:hypothetical protein
LGFGRERESFEQCRAGGDFGLDPWDCEAGALDWDQKGGMRRRLLARIGDVAESAAKMLGAGSYRIAEQRRGFCSVYAATWLDWSLDQMNENKTSAWTDTTGQANAPVCFNFLELLATKSCCGLPNAQLFSQLL